MLDGSDYRHYGYLSKNELKYLAENKTDSRNAGKFEKAISKKAAALAEYLEYLADEIALLESEGYLERDVGWEQLTNLRPKADQYTPVNVYRETDSEFPHHLEFGYYFGYLARQLYQGTTVDQNKPSAVLGFLLGLYARLSSDWNPPSVADSTPFSDENFVLTTELQATFEEVAENLDQIIQTAQWFEESLEANVYTKGSINFCVQQANKSGLTPSIPLTNLLEEILPRYPKQDRAFGVKKWMTERFYVLNEQTEIRKYERLIEYILADIDQIKSRNVGNTEAITVFNTIGKAKTSRQISWIRENLPGGKDQQKEQNVREIKNDLLAKKEGWERALITESDAGYRLSPYGELIWTLLNSKLDPELDFDDNVANVVHATALERWDSIALEQSKYESLVQDAFETVDLIINRDIPVLDLDSVQ